MQKIPTQTTNTPIAIRALLAAQALITLLTFTIPQYALSYEQYVSLSWQALAFQRAAQKADNMSVNVGLVAGIQTGTSPLKSGDVVRVMATAYSSEVGQTDNSPLITASGLHVRPGIMAANFLPFGTVVAINGQIFTIQDRLHSRNNGHYVVDIWQPTTAMATSFGVRAAELTIVSIPRK